MPQQHCGEAGAFDVLRRASRRSNIPVATWSPRSSPPRSPAVSRRAAPARPSPRSPADAGRHGGRPHTAGAARHQALQQEPPRREPGGQVIGITARIEPRQVLGGLISEYRQAA
jgi:hypothetical protein